MPGLGRVSPSPAGGGLVGAHFCLSPLRPAGEALGNGAPPMRSLSTTSSSPSSGTPGPSALTRQNSTSLTGKLGALPANLDDMKVGGCPKAGKAASPGPTHGRQSRAGLWTQVPPAGSLASVQGPPGPGPDISGRHGHEQQHQHLSGPGPTQPCVSSRLRPPRCSVGTGKCPR